MVTSKNKSSTTTSMTTGLQAESDPLPIIQLVINQQTLPPEVLEHSWPGDGTSESPFLVQWLPGDRCNPMNFPSYWRWVSTMLAALAGFTVALTSSIYTGGIKQIMSEFEVSNSVAQLGVSLFVLGFAVGPLLWAPLCEIYGRQIMFISTFGLLTVFNAAAAKSQSIAQLLLFRALAGIFGSSPLTNAGGVIADQFPASERGLALGLFSFGPFMGPVLGPIISGFLCQAAGWRWNLWLAAIICGSVWALNVILVPETYAPVLLEKRARALTKRTGKAHMSYLQQDTERKLGPILKIGLARPWALLLQEPIVLIFSIYMAIIYATMYMFFAAYPIIFQQERGWSSSMGGLAFLGMAIGMIVALTWMIFENKWYNERSKKASGGRVAPEARLPPCMIGAVCVPVGLFWFAWTASPRNIHWSVCLVGSAFFGYGNVLLFISCINYLVDAYVIYAASCIAGSSILRSVLGAVFPLFTVKMYQDLGVNWASSIPAFLALACTPFPFLLMKYGSKIRRRCVYAAEADRVVQKLNEANTVSLQSSNGT